MFELNQSLYLALPVGARSKRQAEPEPSRPRARWDEAGRPALALLPPARHAGGMAKPIAKLISMLKPKRRWAQFSLASMFVVVTVLCVWLSVVVNRAHRQRDAVAAIEALGGTVKYYDPDMEPDPEASEAFLRRWLPRDYLDEVRVVDLGSVQDPDAGLAHLHEMTGLHVLHLFGTQVKDAGLAHVQGLTELRQLSLSLTQVTDAGLEHLNGLTKMEWLSLDDTLITDAGLAHLQELTGLTWLSLGGTQVTQAGQAQFQQALPNCEIYGP